MTRRRPTEDAGMRRATLVLSAAAVLVLGAVGASPAAAAAPRWEVTSLAQPTVFAPADASGRDTYLITVVNVGDAPQDATDLTITDTLPPGLTATEVEFHQSDFGAIYGTPRDDLCPTELQCAFPGATKPLQPGEELSMIVHVALKPSKTSGTLINSATVTGGGAPSVTAKSTNRISAVPSPFGLQDFSVTASNRDGSPSTQAGAHPDALTTSIAFNTVLNGTVAEHGATPLGPAEDEKDINLELPPGLLGNPRAVAQCPLLRWGSEQGCPVASQVGTWNVRSAPVIGITSFSNLPVYNLEPGLGKAAELGLQGPGGNVNGSGEISIGARFTLIAGLSSAGDYHLHTETLIPILQIQSLSVTIWGVPGDPRHDSQRGLGCDGCTGGFPSGEPERAFLTNPTSCTGAPLSVAVSADSWLHPGVYQGASSALPAIDGCNQVPFGPTIKARPTTNLADFPSGLDVDLQLPLKGLLEPAATSESNLNDATVTLPEGVRVNPASANGLGACSEAQIDLHGEGPANCPDSAKLGTVEVETPLLDHPLPGAVYLAKQGENPFGSLLALYIVVDDPQTGVIVKLAGKVAPDPVTGQIAATFEENPQLPFEHFRLHFFKGAQGALRTPSTCGTYTTTSRLTPWSAPESGPPATPHDEFAITSASGGSAACPHSPSEEPNAPVFHAGTESPQAGIYSPFSLKLVRQDGDQEIKAIDTTLPPGLVGKLAGVGECSDGALAAASAPGHSGAAEQASPSCPLASEVGTVDVAAGAGPTPLSVSGRAYLAGPYKGAPLSLAIITPAVAGPFDLGTVVVRTALNVDPETAQIHAVSDPIPTILEGIPLDVRSITLKMSRPSFTLNPTNCAELGFTGSATSTLGSVAPLAQRFQVGGCSALAFKPKLKLSLNGGTKRNQNPAFTATLTMPPGGANIASAQVTLPHSAFLDQAHIGTVCTRVQFAAHACPAASVYGKAIAYTPLLDQPLSGPVYLRSSSNKLPDLVADLDGQIEVTLDGKVDTGKGGGIRNTFQVVPDAPVSKFVLSMQGGNKGLLVNSENICKKPQLAIANFTGQNGKTNDTNPVIANSCGKKGKKKGKGKHRKSASHRVGTTHR